MGTQMVDRNILAFIENEATPLHEVINAIKMVKNEAVEKINPLIITHASSLNSLQMDSSSVDFIISMGTSEDFPGDKLCGEFSRVLKPGGEIFIHQTFDAAKKNTTSSLGRKLLLAGFSSIEVVQMAEVLSEGIQSFGIKGKKPSWKILPKVEVVDEMDVIDEDSLLSEEDLNKSQFPSNTPASQNVSRVNSSKQPPSLQFETIRFPTKTSQNQFHASQPQSPDNHDTPVPDPFHVRTRTRDHNRSVFFSAKVWNKDEEFALVKAWIESENDVPGIGQFWNRVMERFHDEMGFVQDITERQISSKWRGINKKVVKFNDIYNKLLSQRKSGQSEGDIFEKALIEYDLRSTASFGHNIYAWNALQESPKWVKMYGKDHTRSCPKRTKTSDSNDYTTSSDARCHVDLHDEDDTRILVPSQPVKSSEKTANPVCVDISEEDGLTGKVETVDLNDEDDEIEPEDDDIELEEPRSPIGMDKGKRVSSSTLLGSSVDEKIDRLVDKLDKFTSSYGQLEKEKLLMKEKVWEEKVRVQNEAREAEDFKILTTNIDHLTGPSLRAALALKEKIAKRYGFE